MKRCDFITLLGGAALAWPLAARAQQPERRISILLNSAADDPKFQTWVGAFLQTLAVLGWTIGRNVRIDTRWTGANAAEARRHATELAAVAPDVILAHGSSTVGPLLQATRTVPIVFPVIADPVGAGFVDSLARPGGNITGFDAAPAGADLLYFAFVNYTTLGYGDVTPLERWRLLGPMTAMNGVLLFGWSTAVIFEVLRRTVRLGPQPQVQT